MKTQSKKKKYYPPFLHKILHEMGRTDIPFIKPDRKEQKKKTKAFTLIELLTVLAIIAVITAVTIPSYYLMSRGASLNNGARRITETLSAARQMAIARQVYSFIELDSMGNPVPNGYQVEGERTRYVEFDYYIDPITNEKISNNRIRIYFWVTKLNPTVKKYKKVYIGEWIKLPDKIEFYQAGTDYSYPPEYIKFKPNGSIITPASSAPVIFDFAIVDMMTIKDDPAKIKTRVIEVVGITGRIKSESK